MIKMKRGICVFLTLLLTISLASCGSKKKTGSEEPFKPSMDVSTDCKIRVAGGYDNFEALEVEFDNFNEFYPNVELVYTKVDDYNNMIGTVLNGNDAPDIYVNYSWMYGREQYKSSIDHAEDLSDPSLELNLDCIRSNILLKTDDGSIPMVPVFANTYGMLVNNTLFEKEGLSVPKNYRELIEVCQAFREKGYENPMMGFSLFDLDVPVTKTSSALLCLSYDDVAHSRETACINCGRCVEACPEKLIPRITVLCNNLIYFFEAGIVFLSINPIEFMIHFLNGVVLSRTMNPIYFRYTVRKGI